MRKYPRIVFFLLLSFLTFPIYLVQATIARVQVANQIPKGKTMKLTMFTPQMMDAPFDIKYPESWYAREEYYGRGRAEIYLTREKIDKAEDKYFVGASIAAYENKYSSDGPFESKAALVLLDLKKEMEILNAEDAKVGDRRATKVWVENETRKGIIIILPIGRHLYLLSCDALKEEFSNYEEIFEKIIKSFKWRKSLRKAKNPPKRKDPVIEAFASNKRYNATINGEKKENVLVADVIKEWMEKGSESDKEGQI